MKSSEKDTAQRPPKLVIEEDLHQLKSAFVLLTPSDGVVSNSSDVIQHPTLRFYVAIAIIVLGAGFPLGWNVSQLNAPAFHSKTYCSHDNLIKEKCVIFPGHSNFLWTAAVNALLLGAAVGAYVSWYPATKYGRKGATLLQAILGIAAALLQGLSPNIYILILGRFVSGVTAGISTSVASVYIGEISPIALRGILGYDRFRVFPNRNRIGLKKPLHSKHNSRSWSLGTYSSLSLNLFQDFCNSFFKRSSL